MIAFDTLLERLHRHYFPEASFSKGKSGHAIADDPFGRLSSAFEPIVDAANGSIVGHRALLRGADARGRPIAPLDLFALAWEHTSLQRLDRLARALHMVNYFSGANGGRHLFVTMDSRLIALAPDEHRGCFDALLTSLDVPTSRVVITLPETSLDDPVTFVRSALSLKLRGYRVLAAMRVADAHADLEHVFMADPNFVSLNMAGLSRSVDGTGWREHVCKLVEALHARGIRSIAHRIETAGQAEFARDTGFALLQGQYIAPPGMRAMSTRSSARVADIA